MTWLLQPSGGGSAATASTTMTSCTVPSASTLGAFVVLHPALKTPKHLDALLLTPRATTAPVPTTTVPAFSRRRKRPIHLKSPAGALRYSNMDDFEDDEEDGVFFSEDDDEDLTDFETLEDLLMDLDNDLIFLESASDDEKETIVDGDVTKLELNPDDLEKEPDVDELLSLLDNGEDVDDVLENPIPERTTADATNFAFSSDLESALLQGVVPATAGVGSECLPGDWGFDPLNLAEKDWILQTQFFLLQAMPGVEKEDPPPPRPAALILRDYREAEIRHGRLAMLAAIIWPLQEMLDRLLLDADQFSSLLSAKITLPYFPLFMTLIMMLLGYLDIYAKAIQEKDDVGDAFLPGDCFWDPLKILEGAPPTMKRNMQERELFNGRMAMLAVALFAFEEFTTGLPLILIKGNELLFYPAYQIPYIQEYLDQQFSFYS